MVKKMMTNVLRYSLFYRACDYHSSADSDTGLSSDNKYRTFSRHTPYEMYIKKALEFSIFPTVLLLTTVFRLSLNVSTTRGILSKGYAGEVVKTFGEFVMGGDAIVGFIIFVIIVIVNFLVITKGSERVSEVAARFTLDAMPGKQMAIDADLTQAQ